MMNYSDIKKITKLMEYEEDCRRARQEFLEHGVRFYDSKGWGFIRDGVKHYS